MNAFNARRLQFRELHESGCFVIPNPWGVGSAKLLAHIGFKTGADCLCAPGIKSIDDLATVVQELAAKTSATDVDVLLG